jgi:hypothetical protein
MKIFISYRRDDSVSFTGRLFDRLAAHFGSGSIFMDVDAIPLGADFAAILTQEIRQCDLVLAIIGNRWLDATSGDGRRRLDNPNDYLRLEIESALALGIPVVPVLVGEARMPRPKELPASLTELAFRSAVAVRPGPEFHHDLDRLIRALANLVERVPPKQPAKRTQPIPDLDPKELQSNLLFVSHSSLDRQWVEGEIITLLDQNGIETWYAKSAIRTSGQWEREILRGMEKCDWFLLIVSPRAADSEWVKDELFWAIHHRPTRIVPAIMEYCDLWQFHIRLARIQHVDFTTGVHDARRLLVQSLTREAAVHKQANRR